MQASVSGLLKAKQFLKSHPQGVIKFDWATVYNAKEYNVWFMKCLHNKINMNGGINIPISNHDYLMMENDARLINEYYGTRIRRRGGNMLNTPRLKRKYPQVDNPLWED